MEHSVQPFYLVIGIKQAESSSWIEFLNGRDEPVALEGLGWGVGVLDPQAWPRVVPHD